MTTLKGSFVMKRKLKIGEWFWEYNKLFNSGYKRFAHSENHVKYFEEGYGTRAFFTKDELLKKYPNAVI